MGQPSPPNASRSANLLSAPAKLFRGENRIEVRQLTLADGVTALPVASLTAARVEVIQQGVVVGTFVLGTDEELSAGEAANDLKFQLTSAITDELKVGLEVELRWTIIVGDARFDAEPGEVFISKWQETPWKVA